MNRRNATTPPAPRARSGFTLTEMFVVILIASIVLTIAIPTIQQTLDSAERASADNTLSFAATAARDLALQGDGDTGVVVYDEPGVGTRLVIVRQIGTLTEGEPGMGSTLDNPFASPTAPMNTVERDLFVPIDQARSGALPEEWMIAGLAPPGFIDEAWYDGESYSNDGATAPAQVQARAHWLLPESHYFDRTLAGAITAPLRSFTPRQTFMLRYASGSGDPVREPRDALILDPKPGAEGRGEALRNNFGVVNPNDQRPLRADLAENLETWARGILTASDVDRGGSVNPSDDVLRRALLGNYSHDTVLARPVTRLALFRRLEMARGLAASRLDPATNSIYAPMEEDETQPIRFATGAGRRVWPAAVSPTPQQVREALSFWVYGYQNVNTGGLPFTPPAPTLPPRWVRAQVGQVPAGETVPAPPARIFVVQPATGELLEVRR